MTNLSLSDVWFLYKIYKGSVTPFSSNMKWIIVIGICLQSLR